jgi:hypothetical protein
MLTPHEIRQTADAIASVQRRDGAIPWGDGAVADPWDHVEAAMGLDVGGRVREAERAYEWLARAQRPDGSWARAYGRSRIEDAATDANFCAYPAAGVWHHFLATRDIGFLEDMWPVVERGIEVTLSLQAPGGEIWWARDPCGVAWPGALVTSCSSISHSLRCAIAAAERLGLERPDWELSAGALAHAVAHRPDAFEPKPRYSMDWYYPVLAGVLHGTAARARLADRWDEFVVDGLGVRCVSDRPWVTGAETCELVMALDAAGLTAEARRVFAWVRELRHKDGSYWTGITFPEAELWPEERPTWTSGAVLLACDALERSSPTSGLFRGEGLPSGVFPTEAVGEPT